MFGLPLAFTVPAVLVALAGLSVLYYLLRVTPPRPRHVPFPPLRLILDLEPREQTPAFTPWWLLLLRLLIAAALIFAVAGPILNPLPAGGKGKGPLLLLLDDGWPAAPDWDRRLNAASQWISAARHGGETVAVVAASQGAREILVSDAGHALEHLRAIKPQPYAPDRMALVPALEKFMRAWPHADVVWVADGTERGHARQFADRLAHLASHITLVTSDQATYALAGPKNEGGAFAVRVLRSGTKGPAQGTIRALDRKGLTLGEARFDFAGPQAVSATETKSQFDLPVELRNEIARLEIVGQHSAGAVSLIDARWKRRRVGIISGETADRSLPLLAPTYYLTKALSPFADVRQARPDTVDPIASLLADHVAVLILADVGAVTGPDHTKLKEFVQNGGLLLRFAGTRMAASSGDLVPVPLRRGGRVLGGALSWERPKKLAPFDQKSPFFGLKVPNEVTVRRQVLAEPDIGLAAKTWARLADGTPLVTADRMGDGMIVLFHVTADTTWSNLPLSGLFVDMLRRIVALSNATGKNAVQSTKAGQGASQKVETVPPTRILDGFGQLGAPPATAKPVPVNFSGVGTSEHPPGFYGPPEQLLAINAMQANDNLTPADYSGLGFTAQPLRQVAPTDLRPPLLAAAFLFFCLDALLSMWLGGGVRRRFGHATTAAFLLTFAALGALAFAPTLARADPRSADQPLSQRDLNSALNTRLAYVVTGDAEVDQESKDGLTTLSHILARRTSLTPGTPVGVNPARDELTFYPMLYWPIVAGLPQPRPETVAKVSTYMKNGGTIVFDTRDALTARQNGPPTPEAQWLRQLLNGVDVPQLEPVPADHVVTKTFYLLDRFVGRYADGQTWIEALPPANPADGVRPARSGDGVSPIIITSNDLAAGWASDRSGEPLFPLVPGGDRQHEMALRGGVNLVMYTLTGNYKADQVHVRDLLQRLGH